MSCGPRCAGPRALDSCDVPAKTHLSLVMGNSVRGSILYNNNVEWASASGRQTAWGRTERAVTCRGSLPPPGGGRGGRTQCKSVWGHGDAGTVLSGSAVCLGVLLRCSTRSRGRRSAEGRGSWGARATPLSGSLCHGRARGRPPPRARGVL